MQQFIDKTLYKVGYERQSASYLQSGNDGPGLWTSYGRGRVQRDLMGSDQIQMIEKSYFLWSRNPFAYRIVETQKHFVMGSGFTFRADHPKVEEVLREFWNNPINRMDQRIPNMCRNFSIFGENSPSLFVDATGRVEVGHIDPLSIKKVNVSATNCEETISLEVAGPEGKNITLRIVHKDRAGGAAKELPKIYGNVKPERLKGKIVGECFFWAVNRPSGAMRGVSDLYRISDSIEVTDDMIFQMADRAELSNRLVFKWTVKGATQAQILAWMDPNSEEGWPTPENGSNLFQNDKITCEPWHPEINAAEHAEAVKTSLLPVAAGSFTSIHDFGTGEDVNRASAYEMNSPRDKFYTERQSYVISCVQDLLEFVRDQALIFRPEDFADVPEEERGVYVETEQVSMRDETRRASALVSYMTAIATADTLTEEQKQEATLQAFQQAGFDLTTAEGTNGKLELTDEQKAQLAAAVKKIYNPETETDPTNISTKTQEEPQL